MTADEQYIQRCIDLALHGQGAVAPNPMVGSIIVHKGVIIGEGYHQQYGGPHAEVNAVNSVLDQTLLSESTIYVTLEPCAHFGKTPPCANLIVEHNFKRVVIGTKDPFSAVDGKGIERIKQANIEVTIGVLEKECQALNKRFFTFHTKKRPYIILKWAQSRDGFLDRLRTAQNATGINWITQPETKVMVHKWRTEEAAILVGKNTILNDNPQLTAREYAGKNPIRIVIDPKMQIDSTASILDDEAPTLIYNQVNCSKKSSSNEWIHLEHFTIKEIMDDLYQRSIQSVIIEGGFFTLNEFITSNLWDEARVLVGTPIFEEGLLAPIIDQSTSSRMFYGKDELLIFENIHSMQSERKQNQ